MRLHNSPPHTATHPSRVHFSLIVFHDKLRYFVQSFGNKLIPIIGHGGSTNEPRCDPPGSWRFPKPDEDQHLLLGKDT